MLAGMPIWLMVVSIAVTAVLSETPGGRLKETVVATKKILMVDGQRRLALRESGDARQRNHRLRAGRDGRSGRRGPLAGGADRVGREISHRIRCDRADRVLLRGETIVPATALVVCEPLAGPPEVLT